jgi:hAT family C-terminal dimerisation region
MMNDSTNDHLRLHVEAERAQQLKALEFTPWIQWQTIFKNQFPLLSKIAVPILVVPTQSADVERVCKVHKLNHTKIQNRLANDTVYMLLYCYVNLCILKRLDITVEDNASHLEGFLAEALDDDHDSGG